MMTTEEDRMSIEVFTGDSEFSRNCYASMSTPPPPSGTAPAPDSNWTVPSSLRQTAVLGEQKTQMPLLIRVRDVRVLTGAAGFVAVLMLLIAVFTEGVSVGSRDSVATVDELNKYNFYTGSVAAMLAKPFEMALAFFVPVLSLVLSPRNSLQNDSMAWRALLFCAEGALVALLTGSFSTLNVQQLDPLLVPVVVSSDLSSTSSVSGSFETSSDLAFSLRPTVDTLLRTAILPVYVKANESVCQGRGGWPNIATTYAFFGNDWLIDLLPHGREPEYSLYTSIDGVSTTSIPDMNDRLVDGFNASLSANLLLYAMFFSQTLLAWEGLSYLENNPLAEFQEEVASWRAMEDRDLDHGVSVVDFQHAASAMLRMTLDEQSLRLGLNFNTKLVSFNASHVKLSEDIEFDAVTVEIPFDEHAIADNGSTPAALTPASTSTSSNVSVLYELSPITACGESACLIPPPGNSFAATATLGETTYTQWNVEPQIQAFAACIFEDGSEFLTTDYLHGASCTRRSTTSFLVYSFGRRVVADDATIKSSSVLTVSNVQRYHTITLGRLSWRTKDLADNFNAACGVTGNDSTCMGISFQLENASSSAGSARYLIVGESHLPIDSLGEFDGLYSRWTPLAMVTTPTDMQGDLLFQRNIRQNQTNWNLDGLCSTSVDVFATQVEQNHWHMSYGLQESYTAALFLLLQSAVVRQEKLSVDRSRTLDFAGSSTQVTLEARIPLPSALISIIGSVLVLAGAACIAIAARRNHGAIHRDLGVEEIAKVLLIENRFPRLFLDCTLDDPADRTRRPLHSFRISTLVLHHEEPQSSNSGSFIGYST